MPKTYDNIKVEQAMTFILSSNLLREVKNFSPNLKQIT